MSVLHVGVTGHLILSSEERSRLDNSLKSHLTPLRKLLSKVSLVRIYGGCAPGADLFLMPRIAEICRQWGVESELHAVLPCDPPELLHQWRQRLVELGAQPEDALVEQMNESVYTLLKQCGSVTQFTSVGLNMPPQFERLSAWLAEHCECLCAIVRAEHQGLPGGAMHTVMWWEHPELIPLALKQHLCDGHRRNSALILINPGETDVQSSGQQNARLLAVRECLRKGNALRALDLAKAGLKAFGPSLDWEYLHILSLAQSGTLDRALDRFQKIADEHGIPADEDWMALRGRIYKDLGFRHAEGCKYFLKAAHAYSAAFEHSRGLFSAVNAASMFLLANQPQEAQELAQQVIQTADGNAPAEELDAYYHWATLAEAAAVQGDWKACESWLHKANPLQRSNLQARSRTRMQLKHIARKQAAPVELERWMDMPAVYLLDLPSRDLPALSDDLKRRLEGAPVFAAVHRKEHVMALRQIAATGADCHCADPHGLSTALSTSVAAVLEMPGVVDAPAATAEMWADRHVIGGAQFLAKQWGVPLMQLAPNDDNLWQCQPWAANQAPSWWGKQESAPMALVFADLVGFSRLSDEQVSRYWREVVPDIAAVLNDCGEVVRLRQTWGDAIHLVVDDVATAARAALGMLEVVQRHTLRTKALPRWADLRVGAHFAYANAGHDAIQGCPTWFGAQLSLTARVEPVTPPGTVYVTETFGNELQLVAGGQFDLVYAGETELAKGYGSYRLYSVQRHMD